MDYQREILLARARDAFDRRDYPAALADLRVVVEQHPHFADVRHLMGVCLSLMGQREEALEHFDRALEENDGYIDALLSRAITLNDLGRFEEAQADFERAAECESRTGGRFPAAVLARLANAHAGVADLYMSANAPAEAAEELKRALELRPTFHDLRTRRGEALLRAGVLDEAREAWEECRAQEPSNPRLRAYLHLLTVAERG
jgi:tetratricopeptide (TPR) repeat protein